MALDQHTAAMLVLSDLSAAFDTIDHDMLLNRLSDIGIQDTDHDWPRSYLNNRCQSINNNGCKSQNIPWDMVSHKARYLAHSLSRSTLCR